MDPFDPSAEARQGSFSHPPGPPPPYESVVGASAAGQPAAAADNTPQISLPPPLPPQPSDFEISVADPVKQGEGVSAYVSYKVRSTCALPQYSRRSNEVIRRFRDFAWLCGQLGRDHRGVIVPPLPDKNAVSKITGAGADFIEERRRGLQVFLTRVAAHPVLRTSKSLQIFLEMPEDQFGLEVARASLAAQAATAASSSSSGGFAAAAASHGGGVSGAAKGALEGAVGFFKGLGSAASGLVGARGNEAAEDPEYIKVRDYLVSLEAHLGEAARQAGRLGAKEGELGEALAAFGQAIDKLGRLEAGPVAEAFAALASKAATLAAGRRERVAQLGEAFEAPLKEAVRSVRAVTAVCNDRSEALGAYSAAQHDLDAKKVRWAKLRGTPGTPAERLAEAERDTGAAEAKVGDTKIAYEALVAVMTEELNRWQKERAGDVHTLLIELALAQAALSGEAAKVWSALLGDLQGLANNASSSGAAGAAAAAAAAGGGGPGARDAPAAVA